VDWSTCIRKVVLATSRRSRLHQVKSHNPSATSQLVFICEDDVSFVHTHHTSSAAMKKCASLGGTSIATKCDVKEGLLVCVLVFLG
jgi:hypothetical protein